MNYEVDTDSVALFLESAGFSKEKTAEIISNGLAKQGNKLTTLGVMMLAIREIGKDNSILKEEVQMLRGTLLRNRRR